MAHSVVGDRGVLTKLAEKNGEEETGTRSVYKEAEEDEERQRKDSVGGRENEFAWIETESE